MALYISFMSINQEAYKKNSIKYQAKLSQFCLKKRKTNSIKNKCLRSRPIKKFDLKLA